MVDEGNQSADIVYELLSSKSSDKSSDGIIKGLENYVTERTLGDKKTTSDGCYVMSHGLSKQNLCLFYANSKDADQCEYLHN